MTILVIILVPDTTASHVHEDRGSMHVVGHYVIYSPARNKYNNYIPINHCITQFEKQEMYRSAIYMYKVLTLLTAVSAVSRLE